MLDIEALLLEEISTEEVDGMKQLQTTRYKIEETDRAEGYGLLMPAAVLTGKHAHISGIIFETPLGTITLSGNMLKERELTDDARVEVRVELVSTDDFNKSRKSAVAVSAGIKLSVGATGNSWLGVIRNFR